MQRHVTHNKDTRIDTEPSGNLQAKTFPRAESQLYELPVTDLVRLLAVSLAARQLSFHDCIPRCILRG